MSRRPPSVRTAMVFGIIATLVFGVLGSCAWLLWVWSVTPHEVRATVSHRRKAIMITVMVVSLGAYVLGFVMTIVMLVRAFNISASVPASDRARFLAEGISEAMNWSVLGMIPQLVVAVVSLVAGNRLVRRAQSADATS